MDSWNAPLPLRMTRFMRWFLTTTSRLDLIGSDPLAVLGRSLWRVYDECGSLQMIFRQGQLLFDDDAYALAALHLELDGLIACFSEVLPEWMVSEDLERYARMEACALEKRVTLCRAKIRLLHRARGESPFPADLGWMLAGRQ